MSTLSTLGQSRRQFDENSERCRAYVITAVIAATAQNIMKISLYAFAAIIAFALIARRLPEGSTGPWTNPQTR